MWNKSSNGLNKLNQRPNSQTNKTQLITRQAYNSSFPDRSWSTLPSYDWSILPAAGFPLVRFSRPRLITLDVSLFSLLSLSVANLFGGLGSKILRFPWLCNFLKKFIFEWNVLQISSPPDLTVSILEMLSSFLSPRDFRLANFDLSSSVFCSFDISGIFKHGEGIQ